MKEKLISTLSIILCSKIAKEVELLYIDKRITHEQYKTIVPNKNDIYLTIPMAFSEGAYGELLEKIFSEGVFRTAMGADHSAFSAKELANSLLGGNTEQSSKLNSKHFFTDNAEIIIQNAIEEFLEVMRKE